MTRTTVQLMLKSGLLMTNQIREFWYSYDYGNNNNEINNIIRFIQYSKKDQITLSLISKYDEMNTINWRLI